MFLALERDCARRALERFGLGDALLRLLKHSSTTLFRVDAPDVRLVLRLQSTERMPVEVVRSELEWLRYLQRETTLWTIAPLPTLDGAMLVQVDAAEDEAYTCVLFEWMPGRHKARLTVRDAERLGQALGALHRASTTFVPSPDFVRWNFNLDEFLGNAAAIEVADDTIIAPTDKTFLHAAVREVEAGFRALADDPAAWGLIHADTNLTNIRWHAGQPGLIDFEVCCFGPYLFDIGRLLHEFDRLGAHAPTLAAAFHAGYRSLKSLPPLDSPLIRAFKLMSLVDIVTWVLTLSPEIAAPFGEQLLATTLAPIRESMR